MNPVSLPEAVRADLRICRDLPAEEVRGFLSDLWREPDGADAALVFADWLEDQGDARAQPVRWSIHRDTAYTEAARTAYREHFTDWWLRHGRAWLGTVPPGLPLVWQRGSLSARVALPVGRTLGQSATATMQMLRTLRQAPWITRLELEHLATAAPLHDLGPSLHALALRHCQTADLSPLERLTELSWLELGNHTHHRVEVGRLPALQVVALNNAPVLNLLVLAALPELCRVEIVACPLLETLRVEHAPRLRRLSLGSLPSLRHVHLTELPALERLDVAPGGLADLHVHGCPLLPPDEVAAIVVRGRR